MWIMWNPNPLGKLVGDCTVRAISKATNQPWEDAYSGMALEGFLMSDMPSANSVWGAYLKRKGFERHILPIANSTVKDFCQEHPHGTYLLGMGAHVVAVIDGNYYDSWDSGNEIPIYYFKKMED